MSERKGGQPFDTQRKLLASGISIQEIATIRDITRRERAVRAEAPEFGVDMGLDFFLGSSGLFSGDYQERAYEHITFHPAWIETTTQRTTRRLLPERWQGVKERTIRKDVLPADDVAAEIASYARAVVARGEEPATLVDFGAGASVTFAKVAHLLKDDIRAGRVRVITTNIDAAPTETDIPQIRRKFPEDHANNVIEALREKTASFVAADIYELYELLRGDPVHLLFMVDMLPFTDEFIEPLLRITGDMLHPRFGTAVFGFDKTLTDYPSYNPRVPRIRHGLDELVQRGFSQLNPLQVEPGTIHTIDPPEMFPLEIYQGSDAPVFQLYKAEAQRFS